MCQVRAGTYVLLLVPKKIRLPRWPPTKHHHVIYTTRGTYHHAYARQTQVIRKKDNKKKTRRKGTLYNRESEDKNKKE